MWGQVLQFFSCMFLSSRLPCADPSSPGDSSEGRGGPCCPGGGQGQALCTLLWPAVLTPFTPVPTCAPESGHSSLGSQGWGGTGCLPPPIASQWGPGSLSPGTKGAQAPPFSVPLDEGAARDPRRAQRVDPQVLWSGAQLDEGPETP